DGDAAALLGVVRVAVAHSVLTPLPTRSDPDPSALLPLATAGALRPRLLLRLLTLDLRLFDRLGSGLLALAQQPLGRPVGGTALGRALRLGLLAAGSGELPVEQVLLPHRPQVGGDPVEQHADRHAEAEQAEGRRDVHHDLL